MIVCVFGTQLTGRKKFEVEKLSTEDVEMEDLNFYYADYSRCARSVIFVWFQAHHQYLQRCHHAPQGLVVHVSYHDLFEIQLTRRTKLALSHALAQSVKISLFEELISSTIEQTKDIPKLLSETGKIGVSCPRPRDFIS